MQDLAFSAQIRIVYCAQCNWMLRATWMAQELLQTFEEEISAVTLQPGKNGIFEVYVDQMRIWSREMDGGFPEIKQLKQLVRDKVAPGRELGHSDSKH